MCVPSAVFGRIFFQCNLRSSQESSSHNVCTCPPPPPHTHTQNHSRHRSNPRSWGGQTGPPWMGRLVDYMAGRTPAAKLSIPAFYSAALWAMGYHQPLTWLALGTAATGLHLLLPYLYTTHYLKPLKALHKLAAKRRMSVSPTLELLTSNSQNLQLFEQLAAKQSSFGWFCDSLMFMVLLSVSSFRFCLILTGDTCGLWVAAPLVVALLVLVPLRARAIATGQHYRRQWIDLAADVICRAVNIVSNFMDARPPPAIFHGSSPLVLHGLFLSIQGVILLAKILVLEKPLRWSIPVEAAFGTLVSVWLFPTRTRRHVAAGYLPESSADLLPYSAAANLLLSGIVYVAWRAKSEARYLEAFLTRESSKDQATALRPRLVMSTKMFGATPDALPWYLREQLLRLPEVSFIPRCRLPAPSLQSFDLRDLWTVRCFMVSPAGLLVILTHCFRDCGVSCQPTQCSSVHFFLPPFVLSFLLPPSFLRVLCACCLEYCMLVLGSAYVSPPPPPPPPGAQQPLRKQMLEAAVFAPADAS